MSKQGDRHRKVPRTRHQLRQTIAIREVVRASRYRVSA